MAIGPDTPKAQKAWSQLMRTLGRTVPARISTVRLASRQLRAMTATRRAR